MSMFNINSANGNGGLAFPALRGMSAYEIAVKHGFNGTEEEWLKAFGKSEPLILDANLSDYYGGHPEAGDEALEAIKTGRQILVRVPNADGGTNTAIYCPIMMYQVPLNGMYLYMFYLRDEKQDLSALLGQPAGTIFMPTYGEFMMLLSKKYNSNPMEL